MADGVSCPLPDQPPVPICNVNDYPSYCTHNPFGPNANCALDVCCPEYSVYAYIPGLTSNAAFLAVFAVAMLIHVLVGLIWNQWWFMCCMVAGCVDEILGYAGRVWMNQNLWSFEAFMIQVGKSTSLESPREILSFGPSFSRFNPALFYWIFIPCDLISLALQAGGGALSSISSGKNSKGVDLALAGLALQVITLVIFCGLYGDYLWRYFKSEEFKARATTQNSFGLRLRLFYASEALAVVMILVRCAFRVHELKEGYQPENEMLQREELFIGLEGVPIVIAAFFLAVGHPGLIFGDGTGRRSPLASSSKELDVEQNKEETTEGPTEEPADERADEQADEQVDDSGDRTSEKVPRESVPT